MESTLSILMSGGAKTGEKREEETINNTPPLRLCSWPEDLDGNCVLTVEGVGVVVNKAYLSMHSPIFHRMFYGDFLERASNRYEVNDVDSEEFIDLLRVILPTRKAIDEKNVEYLLALADRFMMDHLRAECVSFLCSDTEAARSISCVALIVLAFRYGIDELKTRVGARLFTQESITSLRHCPRFDEITDEARVFLFNMIIARPTSHSMKRVLCNDRCRHFDSTGRCTVCGRAKLEI
ncbi:hypothetical protein PFISCL1PPCAC_7891 [Pristionchus fissidentatus]|uniref:BTB domain-containing protein n=1 Tax=Pristionchus fissidentatus TaxID=1538716 RepID=A0AAV5VAX8_9BILA|nr:hypothetical protein PFISCL1PPCAC_7891 [Pristionchus fissidentatus]